MEVRGRVFWKWFGSFGGLCNYLGSYLMLWMLFGSLLGINVGAGPGGQLFNSGTAVIT